MRTPRTSRVVTAVLALSAVGIAAGAAQAAYGSPESSGTAAAARPNAGHAPAALAAGATSASSATSAASPAAFGTGARLALYYSPFSGIVRSKGVAKVTTNHGLGIFCIKPSVDLDLAKVYPQVTPEWNQSNGYGLLAYWKDTADSGDCPAGQLEVTTYSFGIASPTGTDEPVPSFDVAFSLTVS